MACPIKLVDPLNADVVRCCSTRYDAKKYLAQAIIYAER